MFQSIYLKYYNFAQDQYLFELTDSEFGTCEVAVNAITGYSETRTIGIIQEYQKRNLPVVENVALYNIWMYKYGVSSYYLRQAQDIFCPKYVNNWPEISKQIDKLIEKYQLLK